MTMSTPSGLLGQVLVPGDDAYESARRVWNGAVDRRPAFIVRCRDTTEVTAAVRFAARHGIPLAVRGGGHSIPGLSTCDGGVVIDLGPMRTVIIEGDHVHVGPGVLWRELDSASSGTGSQCLAGRSRTQGWPG